mgnify:CR=1 FL=1
MPIHPARLERTPEGVLYSGAFGDVYHSRDNALGQAHAVFIAGNGLPQRWQGRERFTIVETGFGAGLNFLATWAAWREDAQRCAQLVIVSLDLHPPTREDLARAAVARQLDIEAQLPVLREHVRRDGTPYDELGLDDAALSDEALLDAIVAHPILMNRPVVVTPLATRLCRPSEAAPAPPSRDHLRNAK